MQPTGQGLALKARWNSRRLPSYRPTREARIAGYLLVVLTVGAYLPTSLYPAYQEKFGFSDLTLTLVYAVYPLVSAAALLLFGPASDVLGRRAVLRAGLLLGALGTISFALADAPAWLFVGRALQGVALGAATGAATALIVERAPAGQRHWASILATVVFLGGTALGPILGGVIAQYLPAPQLTPYLLYLVLLAIAWVKVSRLSSATPAAGALKSWRPTLSRIPEVIRWPFLFAAVVGFLAWAVAGMFLSAIPAVLERSAGITNVAVTGLLLGVLLAVAMAVQPLIPLADPRRIQVAGLVFLLLSLVALGMDQGQTLPATLVAAVFAGCGVGLGYGGATTEIDGIVTPEQRGSVNGVLYLAFYLGAGLPAVGLGLLSLRIDLSSALGVLAAALAVIALAALYISPWVARGRDMVAS